jgi:hypothetical protein
MTPFQISGFGFPVLDYEGDSPHKLKISTGLRQWSPFL